MAKPLPLLIGVLGIGATATGGYMLIQKGTGEQGTGASPSNSDPTASTVTQTQHTVDPAQTAETGKANGAGGLGGAGGGGRTGGGPSSQAAETAKLPFEDVEAFLKQDVSKTDCMKDYFSGLDLSKSKGEPIGDKKPEESKFFKDAKDQTPAPSTKSCLVVNWRKGPKSTGKTWDGKFTWLWTFVRGDEGFINFNVMERGSDDGKLKFTGILYLVVKVTPADSDPAKWEIKFNREVKDQAKEAETSKLDEYFPKVGEAVKKADKEEPKEYWDFVEGKDKFGDMCKESSTCAAKPESKKFHWTMEGSDKDDAKKLKDWTSDLKWWESIFEVKDKWFLEKKIENFKGTWTEAAAA